MPSVLILRPLAKPSRPAADGAMWEWLLQNNQQDPPRTDQGSLQQLVSQLRDAGADSGPLETTLLMPASEVLLTGSRIPSRNPAQVRQALPYALEDLLAEDIHQLHFALGPAVDSGKQDDDNNMPWRPVAVTNKETLTHWLERLRTHGLEPGRVLVDCLCLPQSPGELSLAADHAGVLLRGGPASTRQPQGSSRYLGAHLDRAWAGDALEQMLAGDVTATWFGPEHGCEAIAASCSRRETNAPGGLALLVAGMDQAGINLLQGELAPRQGRDHGRLWRFAAMLALTAGVLLLASQLLGIWQLQRHNSALQDAIEAQLQQSFPGIDRITADPLTQARQALAQLQRSSGAGSSAYLQMLAMLAPELAARPSLQMDGMDFRGERLELSLAATNIAELEALADSAREQGLGARLDAVTVDNAAGASATAPAQVSARLILEQATTGTSQGGTP